MVREVHDTAWLAKAIYREHVPLKRLMQGAQHASEVQAVSSTTFGSLPGKPELTVRLASIMQITSELRRLLNT